MSRPKGLMLTHRWSLVKCLHTWMFNLEGFEAVGILNSLDFKNLKIITDKLDSGSNLNSLPFCD